MKQNSDSEKDPNLPSGQPFGVPPGYFEELPGKIRDKIDALPDFEKSGVNPFAIPDGYFEKLPVAVSDRISSKKSLWEQLLRPRFTVPVAFAILIIVAGLYFRTNHRLKNDAELPFTAEDLRNSNIIQTIDEDLFVDVLSGASEDTSFDKIEQYLIDNNIELSQIENAL